ncbi:flagellar hook protein FlgE [Vulgatibacter sp.]|uniref:flagellar hook protein FlgE n=1 Tax=Vulgatibacter sp. TaxID=1971226 RepID=UPI00356894E2
MISSLYTGVTGLAANSLELGVIGDNIANANTIGFKGGRVAFEEALAQSMIGGVGTGLGVKLQAVQRILSQGALLTTGLATDLALQGPGFFVVSGSHAGREGSFFTRAGQFTIDADGYLVNLEGLRVQGYAADGAGTVGGGLGDLAVGDVSSPPRATESITLRANLHADAELVGPWDVAQAGATSNFSTSVTAYDSLGRAHQLEVYFRKNGAGDWEWHAVTDGGGLDGGTAGTPTEVASGTLTFDSDGALTASTQQSSFSPLGASGPQALQFDFGSPGSTEGVTQFAGASAVSFLSQDGYAAGELTGVSIDREGRVVGAFTNGQSRVLGQVAVANFEAPDQLERLGGNLLGLLPLAGQPTIGAPGSGGRATIAAGALEQSNVDLATEFVRMITAQRGFQANSKTITTADQLLSDLIQLKR